MDRFHRSKGVRDLLLGHAFPLSWGNHPGEGAVEGVLEETTAHKAISFQQTAKGNLNPHVERLKTEENL